MPLKQLQRRLCICGCLSAFASTRPEDVFASRACEELLTAYSPRVLAERLKYEAAQKRSESVAKPQLDPRTWLTASELASRLGIHPSAVTHWITKGTFHVPHVLNERGQKRFRLTEVQIALEERKFKGRKKIP